MDIIVLVKQVPDTKEVKLDPRTGNLIREGVESIINPDDLHALEAALMIRDSEGGKTTALSMGPPQSIDAITEAIGMGIDQGILLSDTAFAGADTWATSYTLGKAIEKIEKYDLILCGRQAIDGDTAQIGPQVADHLQIPQVTYVSEIEDISNDNITVKRRLEDGYERIRCPFPVLLTVVGELNSPRYPVMGSLIDACGERAPIKIWNASEIGVQTPDVGLEGSFTQVTRTFAPKFKRETEMLRGETVETVRRLVGKLREIKIVQIT